MRKPTLDELKEGGGSAPPLPTKAAPATPKVIESLVLRGDLSGLGPTERAQFYMQMCEGLGLNPHAQPFAFLRLNGKEVLYATRGATDSLAAIHKLNREIIDGPKVIDVGGTKLVYAVCKATHPNGRVETAIATVPLVDPVNVLMKCETKAKRRATLSILGLGMLDEMELETIPANVQEPGGGVDLGATPGSRDGARPEPAQEPAQEAVPTEAEAFHEDVKGIELAGEGVAVWIKHRASIAAMSVDAREWAWKAIRRRVESVGKMKNSGAWLKKAIAEEDARRAEAAGREQPGAEPAAAATPAPEASAGAPANENDSEPCEP